MMKRRRHGNSHTGRPHHFGPPRSYKVVCSGCGKEAVVPVPPPSDKKIYCIECFNNKEISKEEL